MCYGRAQDAYDAIMSTLAAMIDAIMRNPALTRDQKLAAVRELRRQKKAEAKAVRARIIQDEKDKLQAHRKKSGKGGKGPKPPSPKPH